MVPGRVPRGGGSDLGREAVGRPRAAEFKATPVGVQDELTEEDRLRLDVVRLGDGEILEVGGDGQHFEALIVSRLFEGKRLVQRHQLVYRALGNRMREEIHALSMQTLTPEQWADR